MPRAFQQRGSSRQPIWSTVVNRLASAAIGSGKTTGTLAGLGTATAGATMIRTRGQALIHFDPTSIADVFLVAFGLGIFNADAFAVGITALPGPFSDVGWPWVYHKIVLFGPAVSATESEVAIGQNLWVDVDSKAMRKQRENETLGWVAEGSILSGGGTFDIAIASRHLYLLG